MVKSIFYTRCGFCAVGNGNHNGRDGAACIVPRFIQSLPILAQQIICLRHQVGQRFFLFCGAVNIVLDGFIRIDMIQLRFEGIRVRHTVITDNHTRGLDQTGFNAIVQAEVADNPAEQCFFIVLFAGRRKRRGREVIAAQDIPCLIDTVKAADPDSGLLFSLFFFLGFAFVLGIPAPCVVRLVIDDNNVLCICHLAQHFSHIGFITFGTALIHALALGNSFVCFPCQCLPVGNHNLALT